MSKLPELVMTPKLQIGFDKLYLDFLSSLYLLNQKKSDEETNLWFLKEIAYYLTISYPEKNKHEIEEILYHIIKMAKGQQ